MREYKLQRANHPYLLIPVGILFGIMLILASVHMDNTNTIIILYHLIEIHHTTILLVGIGIIIAFIWAFINLIKQGGNTVIFKIGKNKVMINDEVYQRKELEDISLLIQNKKLRNLILTISGKTHQFHIPNDETFKNLEEEMIKFKKEKNEK